MFYGHWNHPIQGNLGVVDQSVQPGCGEILHHKNGHGVAHVHCSPYPNSHSFQWHLEGNRFFLDRGNDVDTYTTWYPPIVCTIPMMYVGVEYKPQKFLLLFLSLLLTLKPLGGLLWRDSRDRRSGSPSTCRLWIYQMLAWILFWTGRSLRSECPKESLPSERGQRRLMPIQLGVGD